MVGINKVIFFIMYFNNIVIIDVLIVKIVKDVMIGFCVVIGVFIVLMCIGVFEFVVVVGWLLGKKG